MLLPRLGPAGRELKRGGAEVAANRGLVAQRSLECRDGRRKKRGRGENCQENRPSHAPSPRLLRPFLPPLAAEAMQLRPPPFCPVSGLSDHSLATSNWKRSGISADAPISPCFRP